LPGYFATAGGHPDFPSSARHYQLARSPQAQIDIEKALTGRDCPTAGRSDAVIKFLQRREMPTKI